MHNSKTTPYSNKPILSYITSRIRSRQIQGSKIQRRPRIARMHRRNALSPPPIASLPIHPPRHRPPGRRLAHDTTPAPPQRIRRTRIPHGRPTVRRRHLVRPFVRGVHHDGRCAVRRPRVRHETRPRRGVVILQLDRPVARARRHHKVASRTRLGSQRDRRGDLAVCVNRRQYE